MCGAIILIYDLLQNSIKVLGFIYCFIFLYSQPSASYMMSWKKKSEGMNCFWEWESIVMELKICWIMNLWVVDQFVYIFYKGIILLLIQSLSI